VNQSILFGMEWNGVPDVIWSTRWYGRMLFGVPDGMERCYLEYQMVWNNIANLLELVNVWGRF